MNFVNANASNRFSGGICVTVVGHSGLLVAAARCSHVPGWFADAAIRTRTRSCEKDADQSSLDICAPTRGHSE